MEYERLLLANIILDSEIVSICPSKFLCQFVLLQLHLKIPIFLTRILTLSRPSFMFIFTTVSGHVSTYVPAVAPHCRTWYYLSIISPHPCCSLLTALTTSTLGFSFFLKHTCSSYLRRWLTLSFWIRTHS